MQKQKTQQFAKFFLKDLKTKNPKYSYNRLNKIFHVMSPLKQSIVLKEILDKPISLRSKR